MPVQVTGLLGVGASVSPSTLMTPALMAARSVSQERVSLDPRSAGAARKPQERVHSCIQACQIARPATANPRQTAQRVAAAVLFVSREVAQASGSAPVPLLVVGLSSVLSRDRAAC